MIEDLISELQNTESVEKNDAANLEILSGEIKRVLDNSDDTKTARLKKMLVHELDIAVDHFEESHPQVASNMEKLIDMLNKMGI